MQTIKPFLWFENNAEEAVNYYLSVFPQAKVTEVFRCPEGGPLPAGNVLTMQFEVNGIEIVALNGGPHQPFTDAISLFVPCESQAEIDDMWQKFLATGGEVLACGWLRDRFGVSWQIAPHNIVELLQGRDAAGGTRAMAAMMQMKKLDIATLERAGGVA
jgi:predicted 3-demethylubiquinone-9 3-methyltransferase (glyoxalase superfamily)